MSADAIDIFVLDFSDPAIFNPTPERTKVNASSSFELRLDQNIRTLSTNSADAGADVEGLLYVPTLDPADPCNNASAPYIPSNVTRMNNLPTTEYLYIAFAPWFSATCTKSYLAAAKNAPSSAILFYQPGNGTGSPPAVDDPSWSLNDGGQWKSQSPFPAYAVPSSYGGVIMQQLSLYSGKMTQVKNGNLLVQQYNPSDYVRLYATFDITGSSNLPTLWAFLLIVLGVVLLLVCATSFSMHFVQRRRRRSLQHRAEIGEVDLEILGLKRQRLPPEAIEKLPITLYNPTETRTDHPLVNELASSKTTPEMASTTEAIAATAARSQDYNQPTCPICLDDFLANETSVRSLPCHHIYHPKCIDPYLRDNSSLCPVCKTKIIVEGSGYNGEPITNAMVRRERQIRRLRERGQAPASNSSAAESRRWASIQRHFARPTPLNLERRIIGTPAALAPAAATNSQIEMATIEHRGVASPRTAAVPTQNGAVVPTVAETGRVTTRWRTSTLLRRQATTGMDVDEEDRQRRAALPKWRKAFGSIFPGFR